MQFHEPRRGALILAGGRSRRMGADKARLDFGGQTMLERAVEFWRSSGAVEQIYVAVGAPDHFPSLPGGAISLPDLVEGRGPLGGLHAAFSQSDAELLWVSGVDMPLLRREAILPAPKGDAIVYRLDGRPEPLFGVYRRTVLPVIEEMLSQDCGKLRLLLDRVETEYVEAPPELADCFRNVNTPAELLLSRAGKPPILVVCGWSGSGKTTFLEQLIPELTRRGLRVALVKHTHHPPQPERPGSDTDRLRRAGAVEALLISGEEMTLEEARTRLPEADLILAEGFKRSSYPKIEVHRRANGKDFFTRDTTLLAAVTDELLDIAAPQLGLEDTGGCAGLICDFFGLGRATP